MIGELSLLRECSRRHYTVRRFGSRGRRPGNAVLRPGPTSRRITVAVSAATNSFRIQVVLQLRRARGGHGIVDRLQGEEPAPRGNEGVLLRGQRAAELRLRQGDDRLLERS